MIRAALLGVALLLVACRDQRQAKRDELARAEAEQEVARVRLERERAKLLAMKRIANELDALLGEMQAKANEVEAGLDVAVKAKGTPNEVQAIQAVEEGEAELTALQARASKLQEELKTEEARIEALPPSCFTKPPPPECKLP